MESRERDFDAYEIVAGLRRYAQTDLGRLCFIAIFLALWDGFNIGHAFMSCNFLNLPEKTPVTLYSDFLPAVVNESWLE